MEDEEQLKALKAKHDAALRDVQEHYAKAAMGGDEKLWAIMRELYRQHDDNE